MSNSSFRKTLTHPYPIVMIHGGSQTGTNFTGTPDGREGWAQYFVRRGYAVYVVDQVARGRSAHFSQSQGKVADANLERTRAALHRAGALQAVAAGAAAHPMAGRGAGRRSDLRPVLRHRNFPRCRAFAKQQELNSRRRRRAARQDRPGDPADPFAVRRLRLADRRRSGRTWSRRSSPSSRTARRSTRSSSRARPTGSPTCAPRPRSPASARCRSPTIRRSRTARSSPSCARTSPTSPIWCAAGSRPSRRAS